MAKKDKTKKPKPDNDSVEWRSIPGFETYSISSDGRIKNKKGVILTPAIDHKGYHRITLYKKKNNHFRIHRLVAMVFIPNPENLPQVNHINGIKTDNSVHNLEWCDGAYNTKHSFAIGLQTNKGIKHPLAKLTENQVLEIRKTNLIPGVLTKRMLAEQYGVSFASIKDIRAGKSWTHLL